MGLLNYTTTVEVEKSVDEIRRKLVQFGASAVMIGYGEDRQPDSIAFEVATGFGPGSRFSLPARVEGVGRALRAQVKARKIPPRYATREQASRVAWRMLKDWVEVQLAFAQTGQVRTEEIFLAFLVGRNGVTVYQSMVDQLALEAPK